MQPRTPGHSALGWWVKIFIENVHVQIKPKQNLPIQVGPNNMQMKLHGLEDKPTGDRGWMEYVHVHIVHVDTAESRVPNMVIGGVEGFLCSYYDSAVADGHYGMY